MTELESFDLVVVPMSESSELSDWFARQIVINSLQEHIVKATPGDASVRFKTIDNIRARFDEGQFLLPLVHGVTHEVAGLSWFRPKLAPQAPSAKLTYAHRLYQDYLGLGLSTHFARRAHQLAYMRYGGEEDVWLQTDLANERAIATYESIGYHAVAQAKGVVTMIVSLSDFSSGRG